MSLTSFFMRRNCARNDRKRDRGLTIPEGLWIQKDIRYGPHKKQLLDVYRPADQKGPLPVIVSVHGGGWVYGDKELYSYYCMDLAKRGFAVVNFTYRLSPEHRFPCHLEDTTRAFSWVLDHAGDYDLDPNTIFAVGDSAGGHILALFCVLCTNPNFAARYSFAPPVGFVPRAMALHCGVYDLIAVKNTASNILQLTRDVMGHPATDQELREISPAMHIEKGFPPCCIMTANEDFLKDQPVPLIRALEEKEIPYEYRCYGEAAQPLGHVFHLNIRTPQAVACNDDQCAYFRRHMEQ